jgi:hypothetical protein
MDQMMVAVCIAKFLKSRLNAANPLQMMARLYHPTQNLGGE